MTVRLHGWLALAAWLVLALPAHAEQAWPIDPGQSHATFSVRKFWFAHVRGDFPGLRGRLQRGGVSGPGLAEVHAVIDVAGLAIDDAGDRARALGPEFFDAAHYPRIRFDSEPFPLAELASGGVLRGMLELHGQRRPVSFMLLPSACPRTPLACPVRVRGSLSRSAFGMRAWRGTLSDRVELDMQIHLDPSR